MKSFLYAQMFIDIVNEHDEKELKPLVSGLCLALAAIMIETKTPEDEAIFSFERALDYCKDRMKEGRRH